MGRRVRPEAQRSYKVCDAPGCQERIRRGMLMCRSHWFALPPPLRAAISSTWSNRQMAAWSANCLEARRFLSTNTPAAIAARRQGEQL